MLFKKLFLTLPAVVIAQGTDLQTALSSNPDLSTLGTLLQGQPQLLSALGSAQNITVLAPNNAALSALLNSTAGASAASNPGFVAALLQYHVLNGTYFSSQVANTSAFIPTLLTNTSYANVTGGQVVEAFKANNNVSLISGLFQNSTVVTADQNFTGGTLHVINKVLTLPTNVSSALQDASLSAAYGALNATNLLNAVNGLKDVTIFAPNNSAFQNIGSILANASIDTLSSVLRYHVVNGTKPLYSTSLSNTTVTSLEGTEITVRLVNNSVWINNAKVITPNLLVAGGVIHVIDQLLNPSNTTANATGSAGEPAFSGASSATNVPFTSGAPAPAQSTGAGAGGVTSSSTTGGAGPVQTGGGGLGAAAIMGAVGAAFLI